jgi:hypothetical protein
MKLLFVTLAIFLLQITGQAQTTGSVTGTITDSWYRGGGGARLSRSPVLLRVRNVPQVTNSSGVFDFQALLPGPYSLSVEATGFKKAVIREVVISVATIAQVNVTLEIGLANETVTVTTAQEVINSTSPSLTNVINTRQVQDLPLGGRNLYSLPRYKPASAVVGDITRGASVGGLRQTAVNLTQDGINAMDNFVKTSSFFAISSPSLTPPAEFSITTGTVGADAGRGAAQVNIVTKGGSNEFHGNAFLQLINESYNANTFFNNFNSTPRPIPAAALWGFDRGRTVYFLNFGEGGPKTWSGKDKAFFYFSVRSVSAESRPRQ